MTRRRVAQAVREHAANRSRGHLPAGWRRWADQTLAGPTIPWRRVLASAVRRAIAHAAGCHDYAYSRPGPATHPPHRHARPAPAAGHGRRGRRHLRQHGPVGAGRRPGGGQRRHHAQPGSAPSASWCWRAMRPSARRAECAASRTSSSWAAAAPTCASGSPPPRPARPRPDVIVVLHRRLYALARSARARSAGGRHHRRPGDRRARARLGNDRTGPRGMTGSPDRTPHREPLLELPAALADYADRLLLGTGLDAADALLHRQRTA